MFRSAIVFFGLMVPMAAHAQDAVSFTWAEEATELAVVQDTYPAWAPDGEALVFGSDRTGNPEIFFVGVDGADLRQLTDNEDFDGMPVMSPDGAEIAFISDRSGEQDLWVMNADGSAPRNITADGAEDIHPRYSADGQYLYFNSDRDTAPDADRPNQDIYRLNRETGDIERITDDPLSDTYPAPSPDGRYVAFRRVVPGTGRFADGGNPEVFVRDLVTGEERNLTLHPDYDGWPNWSPDGAHIVFASNRAGEVRGSFDVYVMDADGAHPVRLTFGAGDPTYFARPTFAPDGRRLAITRNLGGGADVVVLTLGHDRQIPG